MPHKKAPKVDSEGPKTRAASLQFIETMECLGVTQLPEGPQWSYEIKLDGFRLEAVKVGKKVTLYSRRSNVLNEKFPYIALTSATGQFLLRIMGIVELAAAEEKRTAVDSSICSGTGRWPDWSIVSGGLSHE